MGISRSPITGISYLSYEKLLFDMERTNEVILVDENDTPIGQMDKMEAHRKGVLHRAFSVFIFNDKQELLLQKRAGGKYHSGGLWTNTCCSHPFVGESIQAAAKRRLREEMGFDTELDYLTWFIYKAKLDNDLHEHEFDHVFTGIYNDAPVPDSEEVSDWKYIPLHEVEQELASQPDTYTVWFRIIFPEIKARMSIPKNASV